MNYSLVERMWTIRKTLMQICNDRKYLVSLSDLNQTLDGFKAQFGSNPLRTEQSFLVAHTECPENQLLVFFFAEPKISSKEAKSFLLKLDRERVTQAILVTSDGITAPAKAFLDTKRSKYTLEVFEESELMFNVTEHDYVPSHIVLTNSEKDVVLKKYKVKPSQLPRIKSEDPVAKYYGLQRGQIVKIIRPSETAGRYISYRIVV